MSAFLAALRISRRDASRFKGRSALIMVMIGLPVLVITAVLTGAATTSVTVKEQALTRLGAADARLITFPYRTPVQQDYSGESAYQPKSGDSQRPWTAPEINTLLPGRLLRYQTSPVNVRLPDGFNQADVVEVDLRDPMTAGMRTLQQGRYAAAPGEVAISPKMADLGVRVGDTLTVRRPDRTVKVVGVAENPNRPGSLELAALPEGLLNRQNDGNSSGWLADTAGPVTRSTVRQLNRVGLGVTSRAVLDAHTGDDSRFDGPGRARDLVLLGVAIVLVVMETVLLAGPAFAVGLRRRRRELAMISAQGGSARHLRMIVLADGLVLGGAAAVLGVVLGIGPGLLVESIVAREFDWSQGPAEVPWLPVLGVAVLGLVSGLVAAIVPAVQASRQHTAQVLAGRAAEVRGRARRPVLGIVLLLVGLGATGYAMTRGVVSMTAASVPFVLGMVALMPWLVQAGSRIAARLPLPLRLSVRDAARHRVRTASAAAAVMAATMGAVALGIGSSSAYTHQEEINISVFPLGTTVVGGATAMDGQTWARLKEAVRVRFPGTEIVPGQEVTDAKGRTMWLTVKQTCGPACPQQFHDRPPIGGADLLAFLQKRRDPRAAAALAAGKAVAFSPDVVRDGMIEVVVDRQDGSTRTEIRTIRIPAVVSNGADARQAGAMIPPQALAKAGLGAVERLLYTASPPQDERRMEADLRGEVNGNLYLYAERGKVEDRAFALLIVLGAALVLVLGGTLAATGLAAADMRPDLNNLSAVGAAPRVRRLVVAAQAAYIAGLGAVAGLLAGSVVGVAVTWPLTRNGFGGSRDFLDGPAVIDVPWLFLAAVVLGLPLVAALVAGLFTRTRLVLARRVA
ncbi:MULTISPECIES: FtsX-like permease family protein [unclassified Nonomuraea]|uniref:ABC transporter permease n=1 Tax=unclassified Nonomuraea TaxID=2593643 RepID=UPI003402BC7E